MNRRYYKGKIYQYSLSGDFIAEHESQKAASETLGITYSRINSVITGRNKSAGGFQFSQSKRKTLKSVVRPTRPGLATYDDINATAGQSVNFIDQGVINDRNHREYGKRKVVIGTMQIFCNPDKPIDQIVSKYSKTFKF